jgi:hypothetical protein
MSYESDERVVSMWYESHYFAVGSYFSRTDEGGGGAGSAATRAKPAASRHPAAKSAQLRLVRQRAAMAVQKNTGWRACQSSPNRSTGCAVQRVGRNFPQCPQSSLILYKAKVRRAVLL